MSLVYFNGAYDDTQTVALIKEKTGLELIYGGGAHGFYSCQVKFPDMEDYVTLEMSELNKGESYLCFVDAENHFFAYVNGIADYAYYKPSNLMYNWLAILIHGKDGKFVSEIHSDIRHMYKYCNIPEYVSDTLKEQITLVPLYMSRFVKNVYINYERLFQAGLKFIDQNGNEFITLGSYLLYYNGKHK